MSREEVEALLRAKRESDGIDTGLYDCGLQYVVMDEVDGVGLTFTWFSQMNDLDDLV